jgi:hypothetical protein
MLTPSEGIYGNLNAFTHGSPLLPHTHTIFGQPNLSNCLCGLDCFEARIVRKTKQKYNKTLRHYFTKLKKNTVYWCIKVLSIEKDVAESGVIIKG